MWTRAIKEEYLRKNPEDLRNVGKSSVKSCFEFETSPPLATIDNKETATANTQFIFRVLSMPNYLKDNKTTLSNLVVRCLTTDYLP